MYLPDPAPVWRRLKTGRVNNMVAPVHECTVRHKFVADDGKPLAGAKYRALARKWSKWRTTDASGVATFAVNVTEERVVVAFDDGRSWTLRVGHLDPAASISGCAQRLAHLGYLGREENEPMEDEWIALALRTFQAAVGLPTTGEIDPATVTKLAEAYGV